MQNLRDKLLKAGLVTQEQAQKAEARPTDRRPGPRAAAPEPGSSQPHRGDRPFRREARPAPAAERPVPKLPPLPGSKAHQRIESKKQLALDKALRDLVQGGQVPVDPGATVFYFMTRKGKLRRLELSEAQARQLEAGELAVVERPEPAQIEHSLVPAAVAEQMYALLAKSVRFLNRKESPIGFMSDEELKAQQAAEAADAPDAPTEAVPAGEAESSPAQPE